MGVIMNKNIMSFSILFLWLCIVFGSRPISQSLRFKKNDVVKIHQEQNRYQFIKMSDDYKIIFDKQTGDYWEKDTKLNFYQIEISQKKTNVNDSLFP
ncbi:hypothetical protein J2Y67_004543 [Neobacillus niacini]|nr:hypothetical protein [Neobacillus niacini]